MSALLPLPWVVLAISTVRDAVDLLLLIEGAHEVQEVGAKYTKVLINLCLATPSPDVSTAAVLNVGTIRCPFSQHYLQ